MLKIVFFVPGEFKETVKSAVFDAGAGRIGNYDQCCWEVEGVGQYRPLKGAVPFKGKLEILETVKEYKIEMVCDDELLQDVVSALKLSHPYEEPAYEVISLMRVE